MTFAMITTLKCKKYFGGYYFVFLFAIMFFTFLFYMVSKGFIAKESNVVWILVPFVFFSGGGLLASLYKQRIPILYIDDKFIKVRGFSKKYRVFEIELTKIELSLNAINFSDNEGEFFFPRRMASTKVWDDIATDISKLNFKEIQFNPIES